VITHNPLVSNWADNIVKIKKEENISKVYQWWYKNIKFELLPLLKWKTKP
jgi:hypothetical protein